MGKERFFATLSAWLIISIRLKHPPDYCKFQAEQEVPDWLENQAESAVGTNYGPAGGRFGGRDTRKVRLWLESLKSRGYKKRPIVHQYS